MLIGFRVFYKILVTGYHSMREIIELSINILISDIHKFKETIRCKTLHNGGIGTEINIKFWK